MLHHGALGIAGMDWAAGGDAGRGYVVRAAARAYCEARIRAELARIGARISGRSSRLLHLDGSVEALEGGCSHYGGLRSVRVDRIVGSEGRSQDFDSHFRPLTGHNRERWIRVAEAQLEGLTLPAVELVQLGDGFYVLDGNHRVSVARAFGQEFIDAQVTVWAGGSAGQPA
jgi:hypothetical protein